VSAPGSRESRSSASFPWATALIAGTAVVLSGWAEAEQVLAYERERVLAGEAWRLWTAHVVHFGWKHLVWNLAVLVPAGGWVERLAPGRTRILFLTAAPAIALALLLGEPRLRIFCGLSGLAVAGLVLLACTQLARAPRARDRWFWWSLVLLVAAKIGVEWIRQQALFVPFAEDDVRPLPFAHLVGAVCAVVVHFSSRRRASPR